MSEPSPEEERARKLEEAKRKVEELKKKNKNKKNKKKKDKDSAEVVEVETDIEQVQSNVSETPLNSEEPLSIEEAKTDELVEEANANETKTDKSDSEEKSDKDKQGKTDELPIDSVGNVTNGESDEVSEPTVEEPSQVEDTVTKKEESKGAETSDEVDELFGGQDDKQKDFLTSIQEQQNQDEVLKLNEEVSNLKDQLKQLKFVNIDQESTIEELEEQINLYKTEVADKTLQLNSVQQELAASKLEVEHLKASQQAQQTPVEFSSFGRHSPSRFESSGSIQHPTADPAMLAKWKNWNVDMTNWRSIGVGPVVEF